MPYAMCIPFIYLQYVLEKALQDVIDEIDIVRGVANGLDYLHSRKKPISKMPCP